MLRFQIICVENKGNNEVDSESPVIRQWRLAEKAFCDHGSPQPSRILPAYSMVCVQKVQKGVNSNLDYSQFVFFGLLLVYW